MKSTILTKQAKTFPFNKKENDSKTILFKTNKNGTISRIIESQKQLPEILFITSYPNRECGIATFSQDLIHAIKNKFGSTYSLKVCALEGKDKQYNYPEEVKYVLQTCDLMRYYDMAQKINDDKNIHVVMVQHEFGLFGGEMGDYYIKLLSLIKKPVITTFHTVLPNPDQKRKEDIKSIASLSASIIVMTESSESILEKDYGVPSDKIQVIHHGTHLVKAFNPTGKIDKYHFGDRFVFSTFGLLNSGKCIETALDALPAIIDKFPNVLYLVIGKTHPNVKAEEGERYRDSLETKVVELGLQGHVKFIDKYLDLEDLLAYLQRTNIYLFTSKDPLQAVSGTFSYAMASGCPIISTPIPHAVEMLKDGAGLIVDFHDSEQLSKAVIKLLYDPILLEQMSLNGLHKIAPTSWENSAIAHVELINKHVKKNTKIRYDLPNISLEHIKRLTTDTGMIQFSKIAFPDITTGYTLDDNARALIAVAKHYQMTGDEDDLRLIEIYLNFIIFCQQEDGSFMNYVDYDGTYFDKNRDENLEDSNGRAIWALGEFCSYDCLFSYNNLRLAEMALEKALPTIPNLTSPRAMAFAVKGLYHYNIKSNDKVIQNLITSLADDLVSKFRGVSDSKWRWFEDYLTYANSVLPEAMLYAYLATGNSLFEKTAIMSFDFLMSVIYNNKQIKVISNQGWRNKGKEIASMYGEQPIDVAYTVRTLSLFYDTFGDKDYLKKMAHAFNWFLGKNHLQKIIYNPCTGGCYDGLEEFHVNLNQGAESTVSYLMARLEMEKYFHQSQVVYTTEKSKMNYPERMANKI
jgi:glycosyltransferase involved in cell wall biosynthesis